MSLTISCSFCLRRIGPAISYTCLLLLLALSLQGQQAKTAAPPAVAPIANFTAVAEKAGLTMQEVFGGVDTKKYIIETTGTGIAIFDYDNDGWPDIFIVNGTKIGTSFPAGQAPSNHLYRNNHDGTFTDVTAKAGLTATGWGQGVCVGDYDNDGWEDLYVAYYGKNRLYHNRDGVFTEVADKSGVAGSGKAWGTGCAFVDYDRDGYLDLMVANYVDFDLATAPAPGDRPTCVWKGVPVMCGPRGLPGAKNILYRNNHDGTFTDVAVTAGAAFNEDGREQAGMGSTIADFNGDGHLDIFKTNFSDDTSTQYRNNGDGTFTDATAAAGLGLYTQYLGWGTMFLDFDNDGWPDLILANGHVYPEVDSQHLGSSYKEPRILYHNNGDGTFSDISKSAGLGITTPASSRGMAVGDIWNDGRMSAVVSNMNAPASLLVNQIQTPNHWIAIHTVGVKSNRDGIGARIAVKAGSRVLVDEVRSGSSYISNSDMRVHFGLETVGKVDWIEIRWPSGLSERFTDLGVDAIHTVKEGSGKAVEVDAKKR